MKDKLIRKENVCIIIFNKDEYGYRLNSRFKGSFSINNQSVRIGSTRNLKILRDKIDEELTKKG